MGKRKPKKVVEPPKPARFEMNNIIVEKTSPGLTRLLPIIPDGFHQICFKLLIKKNVLTGKPKYDIVYYECSMLDSSRADKDKGMRTFSVINPETGRSLLVDPKKTQGKQPFLALDPITNKEDYILAPFMVHHDATSGKNYLLDVNKFTDGGLEFIDPETQKTVTADLTKRVDPLSKKPISKEGFRFVGQIKNGEHYVMKSVETGKLQVMDIQGSVVDATAEGYRTLYNPEANTTNLLDDSEGVLVSVSGNVQLEQSPVGEAVEDVALEDKKFKKIIDPETGKTKIVDEKGAVVEAQSHINHYFLFENPNTRKLELLDAAGQPVPDVPVFRVARDPLTDKLVLVDNIGGAPLEVFIPHLTDNENEQGIQTTALTASLTGTDRTRTNTLSPASGNRPFHYLEGGTPDVHAIKNDALDIPLFMDRSNQVIPAKKIYEVIDPETGKVLYFDEEGNLVRLEAMQEKKDSRTTSVLGEAESPREWTQSPKTSETNSKRTGLRMPFQPKKLPSPDATVREDEKTEQEKYFEDLDCEEARNIVSQVNAVGAESRSIFLRILMDVIQLNKEFIRCTMEQKLQAEKKYVTSLIEGKEQRQIQYILELVKSHAGDYDKNQIHANVGRKLDRENELLLDQLDNRITAENKAVMDVIKANVSKDSKKVIKYTNTPCYRNVRRIVYTELMSSLQKEVDQLKREVCELLAREKQTITEQINSLVC